MTTRAREIADLGAVTSRLDTVGASDGALSNRNLIINGAMQVAQRGTSFTGLGTVTTYTLDRWRFADSANPPARYTATQSSDAPSGFANSLKYEVTTADAAVDADELQNADYFIEAQDLQQLDYGSSAAKDITLSFWVKCSVAQNFGFRLQHEDGGGGYTKSYAVNSANTWEYKTLTFPGNTATNFANDNGRGFRVRWCLTAGTDHTGSDSTAWGNGDLFGLHENTWVATSGATWQITGVQLEVGDTATPFEHRSYGDELARCQRYYWRWQGNAGDETSLGAGFYNSTTNALIHLPHPVRMRAKPTGSTGSSTDIRIGVAGSNIAGTVNDLVTDDSEYSVLLQITTSSQTQGASCRARLHNSANAFIAYDAEL